MSMPNRQKITVPVGIPKINKHNPLKVNIEPAYIDMSIDLKDLISKLQKKLNEYGGEYSDLYIREDQEYGSTIFYLMGTREETDLEYKVRLQKEAKFKEHVDKQERQQYETLKKKFEGK